MKTDLVLCAIIPLIEKQIDEQILWMDIDHLNEKEFKKKYEIIPVINHPHSDIENGQLEVHYHIDNRYNGKQPHLKNYTVNAIDKRPLKNSYFYDFIPLIKHDENHNFVTSVKLIQNSKLKHKCIHKGKCPHRGFDLSNEPSVNGVITCPLHSLRFNAETKKIIE